MLTIEIITFIGSILFGIVLYWRESKSNRVYKFFNALFYSKDLQMKIGSKKGFLYQQSFLMRLVYLGALYLLVIVIIQFLIPFDMGLVQIIAPSLFGTLVGTYLANFVFKSSEVIDEKGDSLVDVVKDTVEKGKDFIKDLEARDDKIDEEPIKETKEEPEAPKKSARQRLKDKGHL
ncbi:hypothetical protein [Lacinutrix jangbogonensis]|uniref:hypothetical protein n=1 Tax=Lacinutrix jangbogonensis TaxID=1469557 RepID=UPI00053DE56B|nr:hypothetical protein [Lacinutrix jangbogonensis]